MASLQSQPVTLDLDTVNSIVRGCSMNDPHVRVRPNRKRYNRVTAEQFLISLRRTGNVTYSAVSAGVTSRVVYLWREKYADFKTAWDQVIECCTDDLEMEARRRGAEGWEEPVYQKGELVGQIRKYDGNLLIKLLEAHRPEKYRQKELKVTIEQADSWIREACEQHKIPYVEPKQLPPAPDK